MIDHLPQLLSTGRPEDTWPHCQPWVGIGGGVGGASAPGECRRMTAVDGHVRRDPHPFRFSTQAKNPWCPGEFESHSDGAWNAPSSRIPPPQRGRTVSEAARHGNLRAGSLGTAAVQRARCLERSDAPVAGRDQYHGGQHRQHVRTVC